MATRNLDASLIRHPLTCLVTGLVIFILCPGFASAEGSGDWLHYSGSAASTKYADIRQIDRTNLDDIRMVWTWRTPDHEIIEANDAIRPEWSNRVTPIVVDGVMYASTPLNIVVALNAETGEELWRFDPQAWSEETYFTAAFPTGVTVKRSGSSSAHLPVTCTPWTQLRVCPTRHSVTADTLT
jgi:glucose dehydrogenase